MANSKYFWQFRSHMKDTAIGTAEIKSYFYHTLLQSWLEMTNLVTFYGPLIFTKGSYWSPHECTVESRLSDIGESDIRHIRRYLFSGVWFPISSMYLNLVYPTSPYPKVRYIRYDFSVSIWKPNFGNLQGVKKKSLRFQISILGFYNCWKLLTFCMCLVISGKFLLFSKFFDFQPKIRKNAIFNFVPFMKIRFL